MTLGWGAGFLIWGRGFGFAQLACGLQTLWTVAPVR